MGTEMLRTPPASATDAPSERGAAALVVVLFLALAVAALAVGSTMVATNARLIHSYNDRMSVLETVAEAGIAEGRSRLNGNRALMPDSGYVTLENQVAVTDAAGNVIPNATRSTYAGPSGVTTGQYGAFGSLVVVVEDAQGERLIRRQELRDESFAKYAFFTNTYPSFLGWARGEAVFGPVHVNSSFNVWNVPAANPPATFHGRVTTAGSINGKQYADFRDGYEEGAATISLPTTADLNDLQQLAQLAGYAFTSPAGGNDGQAMVRVEFVPVDLDADGTFLGPDEGFFRVYRARTALDAGHVVASLPLLGMGFSDNCGDTESGEFLALIAHPGTHTHDGQTAATSASARCHLGGSDRLHANAANPTGRFVASDAHGDWLAYGGTIDPAVLAARPDDAAYLFPLSRQLNNEFKGVIHITGKAAVSGTLRGRVTLAATDNLILADDIHYVIDPGTPGRVCRDDDILGLFTGRDFVIADNTLNAPQRPPLGGAYRTFDDTKDEYIHGTFLALNSRYVENYTTGSTNAEACEGTPWGRGCLYVTGGQITKNHAPTGVTNGTGYLRRMSHDQCAGEYPPPYFPTVGHFVVSRYFEVDPTGFDIDEYFDRIAAN